MGDNGPSSLVGAELDVNIGSLLLDLRAGIAKLSDSMKTLAKEWEYARRGPVFVQLAGTCNVNAAQADSVVDLGGPAYGRAWEVRNLAVSYVTFNKTVTGEALFIVSSSAPVGATGVALQWYMGTLPATQAFSSYQFRIEHPNHVFGIITAGAASTAYSLAGDAMDVPSGPASQVVSI